MRLLLRWRQKAALPMPPVFAANIRRARGIVGGQARDIVADIPKARRMSFIKMYGEKTGGFLSLRGAFAVCYAAAIAIRCFWILLPRTLGRFLQMVTILTANGRGKLQLQLSRRQNINRYQTENAARLLTRVAKQCRRVCAGVAAVAISKSFGL